MTRQAEHVKRRRKQGLCGREGCVVVTGSKYRCPEHAAEHAAVIKAREERLRTEKGRAA